MTVYFWIPIILLWLAVVADGSFNVAHSEEDPNNDNSVLFRQVGQDLVNQNHSSASFGTAVFLANRNGSRLVLGDPQHVWEASANQTPHAGGIFGLELVGDDSFWKLQWSLAGSPDDEPSPRRSSDASLGRAQDLFVSADGTRVAVHRRRGENETDILEIYRVLPDANIILEKRVSLPSDASDDEERCMALSPDAKWIVMGACRETLLTTLVPTKIRLYSLQGKDGVGWNPIAGTQYGLDGWVAAMSETAHRLVIVSRYRDGVSSIVHVLERKASSSTSEYKRIGQSLVIKDNVHSVDMSLEGDTFVLVTATFRVTVYSRWHDTLWIEKGDLSSLSLMSRHVQLSSNGYRLVAAEGNVVRFFDWVDDEWMSPLSAAQVGHHEDNIFERSDATKARNAAHLTLNGTVVGLSLSGDGSRVALGVGGNRVQVYNLAVDVNYTTSTEATNTTEKPSSGNDVSVMVEACQCDVVGTCVRHTMMAQDELFVCVKTATPTNLAVSAPGQKTRLSQQRHVPLVVKVHNLTLSQGKHKVYPITDGNTKNEMTWVVLNDDSCTIRTRLPEDFFRPSFRGRKRRELVVEGMAMVEDVSSHRGQLRAPFRVDIPLVSFRLWTYVQRQAKVIAFLSVVILIAAAFALWIILARIIRQSRRQSRHSPKLAAQRQKRYDNIYKIWLQSRGVNIQEEEDDDTVVSQTDDETVASVSLRRCDTARLMRLEEAKEVVVTDPHDDDGGIRGYMPESYRIQRG